MAKLTAAQLKALPDEMFGLPKTRQYPMPDKVHVIKAIQFFKYCKDKDKKELAKNINRRAKELKMKIRVQPTSAFYKYADRSILKEGTVVSEFHIGQLSPITPISPAIMIKGPGKEEMDKLKTTWDSTKELDEKNEISLDVAEEALSVDNDLSTAFIQICEANYMLSSYSNLKDIKFANLEFENLASRMYDHDNYTLESLMANSPDVILAMNVDAMSNPGLKAMAIAAIKHTDTIYDEVERQAVLDRIRDMKNGVNHDAFYNYFLSYGKDDFSKSLQLDKSSGMSDQANSIIDKFLRNVALKYNNINNIIENLYHKLNPNSDYYRYSATENILLLEDMKNNLGYGYRIENIINENVYFIYNPENNKVGICIFNAPKGSYPMNANTKEVFIVYIAYDNDKEYETNAIAYFSEAKINIKMKVCYVYIKPSIEDIKLEATDFQEAVSNLKIDTDGNVSMVFDYLTPWSEKYKMVKKALAKNETEQNYIAYKNNLAFLFSMIVVINNRYDSTPSENLDKKDALSTLDKSINLFKNSIPVICKQEKNFSFVDYYLNNDFNGKINIYNDNAPDVLKSLVSRDYLWIMT